MRNVTGVSTVRFATREALSLNYRTGSGSDRVDRAPFNPQKTRICRRWIIVRLDSVANEAVKTEACYAEGVVEDKPLQ